MMKKIQIIKKNIQDQATTSKKEELRHKSERSVYNKLYSDTTESTEAQRTSSNNI